MRDRAWVAVLCLLAAITVTACAGIVSELPGGDAGNPSTGEGCIPVAMTGTEPPPDAMTSTEPLPDAMTSTEPLPDAMTGSEPAPDAMTNYF